MEGPAGAARTEFSVAPGPEGNTGIDEKSHEGCLPASACRSLDCCCVMRRKAWFPIERCKLSRSCCFCLELVKAFSGRRLTTASFERSDFTLDLCNRSARCICPPFRGNSVRRNLTLDVKTRNCAGFPAHGQDRPCEYLLRLGCVRRRMIWNRRPDFGADGSGSSGLGYAAWRWWFKRRFWMVCSLVRLRSAKMDSPRPK